MLSFVYQLHQVEKDKTILNFEINDHSNMDLKYNQNTLQKIEGILKAAQYIVRYEKGHFTSGYCILKDKKVVVVNRFFDVEARINCLIEILEQLEVRPEMIQDDKLLSFYYQLQQKRIQL